MLTTIQSNDDKLYESEAISITRTSLNFELIDDELVYHVDESRRRLNISAAIEQEMFRIIYDEIYYADIHRCYARIVDILYVSRLFRKLRKYIEYYSLCQITQIKRYRSYDEFISINSLFKFFYTLVINFIAVLFNELDMILSVICKFSRRITLISDKSIYSVSQ